MRFTHRLHDSDLFATGALSRLAERLSTAQIERRFADNMPNGAFCKIDDALPPVEAHIREIADRPAWIMLADIQSDPAYGDAIRAILAAMASCIEPLTGPVRAVRGFVFISSGGAVTPLHFDPEYNLFFQLSGQKDFSLLGQGASLISPETDERLHVGGQNMLPHIPISQVPAKCHHLASGDGLYVPYKVPHWIRVSDAVSISLSITWKSDWCIEQESAHRFNASLRKSGYRPKPLPDWPRRSRAKAIGGRVLGRIGLPA